MYRSRRISDYYYSGYYFRFFDEERVPVDPLNHCLDVNLVPREVQSGATYRNDGQGPRKHRSAEGGPGRLVVVPELSWLSRGTSGTGGP